MNSGGTGSGLSAVRASVTDAFPGAARRAFPGEAVFTRRQGEAEDGSVRFGVAAAGTRMTVQVQVGPLPGGAPSCLAPGTAQGEYMMHVSPEAAPQATWVLEGMLRQLRALTAGSALGLPRDLLVPGPFIPAAGRLTFADRRRLAGLADTAGMMRNPARSSGERSAARARFAGLLSAAGMRTAGQGAADERAVRTRQELAGRLLPAGAAAALREYAPPAPQRPGTRMPDARVPGPDRRPHGGVPAPGM